MDGRPKIKPSFQIPPAQCGREVKHLCKEKSRLKFIPLNFWAVLGLFSLQFKLRILLLQSETNIKIILNKQKRRTLQKCNGVLGE